MKFSTLANYFLQIEETSSRITMTETLSDLFKKIDASEIDKVLYLLQGRVLPLYVKSDFGLGEKMVIRGIAQAFNIDQKLLVTLFHKTGDLGKAVEKLREETISLYSKDLSVADVYETLYKITKTAGEGSQEGKLAHLISLLQTLDPLSCRYVVRIPISTLRLGFSDMTILDAFSWMLQGDKKLRPTIEEAYHVRPDLGLIGKVLKEDGIKGLSKVKPAVFTPILMMRAERLSNAEEILKKTNGECSVEPKYDGFRVQVHYKKGVRSQDSGVRLYSRGLEDVTYMYPDVVEAVQKQLDAEEVIFEGEAIGYNPLSGDFLPFQETVQRKRKYGIEDKVKEIPLILFAFDILYINGESLLKKPFSDRRLILQKSVTGGDDIFTNGVIVAKDEIVNDSKKIELIFDDAISRGLEGIVVKKLDGVYQAGARGWNWIKYKRSYSSKIEDTIDCLVMGYDVGKGKRTSFGIGAILVGVYDEKMDKFVTVAKIGTGLTDEEWREIEKQCQKIRSSTKPALYEVDAMMNADIWVKPGIVLEIKADEITRSPVHTAGRTLKKTKTEKAMEVDTPGFALRFPRLQRFRDDKRPEEVTALEEVQHLFSQQKH